MTTNICIYEAKEPIIDKREILRYAKARENFGECSTLLDECLDIALPTISYRALYRIVPLSLAGSLVTLGDRNVRSESLARHLSGCSSAVIIAATLGVGIDRLISRYSATSLLRAHLFDAIGTERIEALCDSLSEHIKDEFFSEGLTLTSRFSQGYGDLPLDFGRDIFSLLDCERKIGLYLNESLSMSPRKSVTAIIGIRKTK